MIAAVWVGEGLPTKPAFPTTRLRAGRDSEPTTKDQPFRRVKVTSVPESALHEMGLQLYSMSKEDVFSVSLRAVLLEMSNALHAEAGKIETARVRAVFDRKS